MDVALRLQTSEIFAHLSHRHLDVLAAATAPVRYKPGRMVFSEGDESRDTYFIESGSIHIERDTPYGRYQLAVLGSDRLFGEASFIDNNPRSADAINKQGEAVLLSFSSARLNALANKDRSFAIALYWTLWKSLSDKLRKTNTRLAHFFESAPSGGPAPPTPAEYSDRSIKIEIGAKRELFREQRLSAMEINFLSTLSKEERIPPNEVIFREGEDGDRLYVVLEGQVMISKQIVGAGEEALAFLERGDYFGEMALIDHEPRSADARAHSGGALVLSLAREVIEGILDIQKLSSLRLLQLLCQLISKRLREVDDKLVGWHIFSAGSGGSSLEAPKVEDKS